MDYSGFLQNNLTGLVAKLGDLGVFIAMFFESSIAPIPSEVIIISAGAFGVPLWSVVIFGALGSTLGAVVGYALGRYAAMPILLKFGRFILIKPQHIYKAEEFAAKYGVAGVFIGRVIPIVPFKVFSIAAGITCIPFAPFVICTLLGVIPRIFLLAIFGAAIARYSKIVFILIIFAVLIFMIYRVLDLVYAKKGDSQ